MEIKYEKECDAEILNELRRKEHILREDDLSYFPALIAISRSGGHVEAVFDPRRSGSVAIH